MLSEPEKGECIYWKGFSFLLSLVQLENESTVVTSIHLWNPLIRSCGH